jgi:hypothetical protein
LEDLTVVEILGFGVTAQVGKDTAAEYIERRFPDAKRISFADRLKEVAQLLFGLSYEQCYGPVSVKEKIDPRYGLTPREIMQGLGQKMREIYPDIWIDTVFNITIPQLEAVGFDKFVISDVRYPNEAKIIERNGGYLVKLERDAGGVSVGAEHSSETAMNCFNDYFKIIENNGTIDEFFGKIDVLVGELGWQSKEEKEQIQTVAV